MVKSNKKKLTVKSKKITKKSQIKKPAKRGKILVTSVRRSSKRGGDRKNRIIKKKKAAPAKATARRRKIIVKKPIKKITIKQVKIKAVRKIIKKVVKTSVEGFPAEALFKAKIKVIGVGGGGGSIVSEIGRSLEKATFVIADTDIRALKKKSGIKYFWFGEDLTHGLGTGVNIELAKQAAEASREKISELFKDQDIIIFVASLGGGLGSGATQVFADAAREFGGITLGIFTMPFKFEGKNKYRIAQNALKSLRQSLNVSLVIPNEKIFKIIDSSTPITSAFSTVNKSLIESLESLIDLIYNPGVINIDFADLRTILKGRGNSAFLNTVEESGKDRVEKTCENIFKNPLLQNNNFKAEKILFNICGDENLSMFDVEKISTHMTGLNPKAKTIFGISKNPKLKNKIKTTVLMTGGSSGLEAKEEVAAEKEKSVKSIEEVISILPKQAEKIKIPAKKEIVAILKKEKILPSPKVKKQKKIKIKKPSTFSKKNQKPVSFVPVLKIPESVVPVINVPESSQKKMEIVETSAAFAKKTIRRSGLEIKKAEELQEKKRIAQEKEWEIPAFLRKVKFKG